jgi:transposase
MRITFFFSFSHTSKYMNFLFETAFKSQRSMVNRSISADLKNCALKLWETGWHRSDICYALSVSPSSLYRWKHIFEEFGTTNRPTSPLIGRPRLITMAVLTAVKELYENHPDTYIDELQWFLAVHHDIQISISALQENLEKTGLTRKMLHKIASERDVQTRADFLHAIQTQFSGTGSEFVVIDESCKNEHDVARRFGRAPVGQAPQFVDPFIRGERYSLVAAMSTIGYIATRVQPGSFDSFGFFDFIVEEVVSTTLACEP